MHRESVYFHSKPPAFIFGVLVFGDGIANLYSSAGRIQSGATCKVEKEVCVERVKDGWLKFSSCQGHDLSLHHL
jgi:hypothetical protein